jgi:CO/xanthine dehydrogenase FAD-binding subunit
MRGSIDYPLAAVASVINADNKGNIVDPLVVIGAVGPSPRIVPKISSLKGRGLSIEYIDAIAQAAFKISEGANNQPLSGLYRRKMIKVLTKRAINNSLKDIHGEQ